MTAETPKSFYSKSELKRSAHQRTYANLKALSDGRIGLNERLGDYIGLRLEAAAILKELHDLRRLAGMISEDPST